MNYIPPPNKQVYNEKVWALVCHIPYGMVATYGRIAKMLRFPDEFLVDESGAEALWFEKFGFNQLNDEEYQVSAPRWVGLAMAVCPDNVPWHRVVNSQGKISHPQAARQRKRLEAEGVLYTKDKINLDEYEWCGAQQIEKPKQGQLF